MEDPTIRVALVNLVGILIASLIGVAGGIVGSWIGADTSNRAARELEEERWQRQTREQQAQAQRTALASALDWYIPIWNAFAEVSAIIRGDITQGVTEWPDLGGELKAHALRPSDIALLPKGMYTMPAEMISQIERMKLLYWELDEKHRSETVLFEWRQRQPDEESEKAIAELESYLSNIPAISSRTLR